MEAWEKRSVRVGSAPTQLTMRALSQLAGISVPLQNSLLACTAQDTILGIYLISNDSDLLTSIISPLAPSGEGTQERSIESIVLRTMYDLPDLSNFFARSRFPKLQHLQLTGTIKTPLWNYLASQTTRLTSLSLSFSPSHRSPSPSTSQLLSILLPNPDLQELSLAGAAFPYDIDESGVQVPLPRLKKMTFSGKFRLLFGFLQRLELPAALDYTELVFHYPKGEHPSISRTLGPYMENHLRRDTRFKEKLNVICLQGRIEVYPGRRLERPPSFERAPRPL